MEVQPIIGYNIGTRYKILSTIGHGTFSIVVELFDRHTSQLIACKILKSRHYYLIGMQEYHILNQIKLSDPDDLFSIIKVIGVMDVQIQLQTPITHCAILLPKTGLSLYNWIKHYGTLQLQTISEIGKQVLEALEFIHSKINVIHTDIKPENIVFDKFNKDEDFKNRTRLNNKIRIIGFGNCVNGLTTNNTAVSTRNYRAPEIIIKNNWGYQIDIWSLGCVLYELYTGKILFQYIDDIQYLIRMQQILGPLPDHVLQNCHPDLVNEVTQSDYHPGSLNTTTLGSDDFKNILIRMLDYDQNTRIKPSEALQHPFFLT